MTACYYLHIDVWQTERGWSARDDSYGIETEGEETENDAIDWVVGTVLGALGARKSPPRKVECRVHHRLDKVPDDWSEDTPP